MFKGSLVALITPMRADGSVDEKAYAALVEWQIKEGTNGVVPVGTTGESPTLSHAEHRRVVEIALEVAKGRVPVIAGTGSNSTEEAIELTRHAKEAGADAALVVTPYITSRRRRECSCTPRDCRLGRPAAHHLQHSAAQRGGHECGDDGQAREAPQCDRREGRDGEPTRPLHTRRACGDDFCQLSGEDHTALAFNAVGGGGCISVTANVAPRLCSEMQTAWADGRVGEAMASRTGWCRCTMRYSAETESGAGEIRGFAARYSSERCRLPLAPSWRRRGRA